MGSERYEAIYGAQEGAIGMNTTLKLKGIGISFIDN